MSITVNINSVDQSSQIAWESLQVIQKLTNLVDTAHFTVRKYGSKTLTPSYDDDVEILDGATKIFSGKIIQVDEELESSASGVVYNVKCVDHSYRFDKLLVSSTYENQTINQIIADIISNFTDVTFTDNNVDAAITVDKVVFNQVHPSICLKRLARLVSYDWYIDADKDIHFFSKSINNAPFDLTDTNGNHITKSLKRNVDGSQLANVVKVRGGEYNGDSETDIITVNGADQKLFRLGEKYANLVIRLDTGGGFVAQTVGNRFEDDFVANDVLHNFQSKTIEFETALADGDRIEVTGNPKIRVFAISEDTVSIASFGRIEKLVRENDIKDNQYARDRALAELLVYSAEIVNAKFSTFTSELRTGQLINIQSTKRGSDDDLLIKTVKFRTKSPTEFMYDVECITSKQVEFIELLQKIVAAEPLDIDELETSEAIFADIATVTIAESIDVVTPVEDDATVTITESILLDPVAPANVNWVYGYFAPSSQSDTDRMAKYDRDSIYS